MQVETMLLRGLFGACALICGLTLAVMVTTTPASSAPAGHAVAAASAHIVQAHARLAG